MSQPLSPAVLLLDGSMGHELKARGLTESFATAMHAYYVPYHNGTYYHGYAVRVSLSDFTASGVEVLNLAGDGNSHLKGFYGGFASGDYGYLVPSNNGYSGKAARFVTPQGPRLPPSPVPTSLERRT